ncbi:MAG TPA: serine--tRNA ligase, partial [Armatimonadota bacterium]|nr:serine--tRNA ligase [Armatimonadota bacterium]
MLDPKLLRYAPEVVADGMRRRHTVIDLDVLTTLEERRRAALSRVETLKAERNAVSQQIAALKKRKEDAGGHITAMRRVGEEIKRLDEEASGIEVEFTELLMAIPNIPDAGVPDGEGAADNVVVRAWGEPTTFDFSAKPHWELGAALGLLDFERAARIAQARFSLLWGAGAALERALMNFFLNLHTREHGYTEVWPPFVVAPESLRASGQLPKFEEDLFRLREGLYPAPTSEVQLTNLHRDEILDGATLPRYYTAYSPCFRAEAGAAGQESRGLIRQHQ